MEIVLLEKKTNIVDYNKVVIPSNYVLILPDPNHDFYHNDKGEETGLMVGRSLMVDKAKDDELDSRYEDTVTNDAMHYAVKGKVFALPKKLLFPRKEIKSLRKSFGNNHADMNRLGEVTRKCLEWDTDIEVEIGDEVLFDYLAHISCYEEGRWIETELGDMFLVRYDELHLSIKPDGTKKPLNGWMVITREEKPKETESGIALFHAKEDDISKKAFARVIHQGTPIRGYKHDLDRADDPHDFKEGDRVLYRPGGSRPLEWMLHQTLYPGKKALLIHRENIFYTESHV